MLDSLSLFYISKLLSFLLFKASACMSRLLIDDLSTLECLSSLFLRADLDLDMFFDLVLFFRLVFRFGSIVLKGEFYPDLSIGESL